MTPEGGRKPRGGKDGDRAHVGKRTRISKELPQRYRVIWVIGLEPLGGHALMGSFSVQTWAHKRVVLPLTGSSPLY